MKRSTLDGSFDSDSDIVWDGFHIADPTDPYLRIAWVLMRGTRQQHSQAACHYRDEGCQFHPSCLKCPEPKCLFERDSSARKTPQHDAALASKVWNMVKVERKSITTTAAGLGIGYRRVQRLLTYHSKAC